MEKKYTKWTVSIRPGESKKTRDGTVITNADNRSIKVIVECPVTNPEGTTPNAQDD